MSGLVVFMSRTVIVVKAILWSCFLLTCSNAKPIHQFKGYEFAGDDRDENSRILKNPQSKFGPHTSVPTSAPTLFSNASSTIKPPMSWAFLFPLLSMSYLMWALRKHGKRCCSDSDVLDDEVPLEIVVTHKEEKLEDIELQEIPVLRLDTEKDKDPVEGLSMLNTSDWTEDDPWKDHSGSGFDEVSSLGYRQMKY